jgi:DNA-binding SARP family transcriptional activator
LSARANQSTVVADKAGLSVRLFGNFGMEVDGQPFVMATPRQTLSIFAYLLLNRGTAVSREFLSFFMWPDEGEETARRKLRANLYDLGKVLPPASGERWILADGDNVSWNPAAPLRLDTEEFEACCNEPERREAGIELYRGDLLTSLYDEWVFPPRERYRNLYLATLTELISEARRRRDFPRAIAYAQRLLSVDPWREDIVRRLMAVRYESGDRSGGLNEYQRFAERLRAELDIEPMPETLALRDALARDLPIDPEPAPTRGGSGAGASAPALPFVGRVSELEILNEAWNRAAQGKGGIVFVGGESGIGKSRLALEFAHRVDELGGRVISGTTGMPEAMPYQAVVEGLRSALPLIASLRVRDAWLATIATLVPELRGHLPALPELSRIAPDGEQARLFESLAGTLAALAQARPLLFVVEDVQWAGEATSAALQSLAARVATQRILIVATYRDDELPRLHPLQRLRRDAVAAGQARSITLRTLALEDVETLVGSLARHGTITAESLYASSDGNPLFLSQFLDGGDAPDRAADNVRGLVARRVGQITPKTRTVAEIAALIGTQFSGDVVRRVSGWDVAAVDDALDELIERRIVREASGRGFFDYAFAHHLIQQTVAEAAEEGRAAARHRRIARALDELYPERAGELAPRIARHYDLAGDAASAARHYLSAARQALALGAVDEAAAHVARGLELTSDLPMRVELLLVGESLAARRLNPEARTSAIDELEALTNELGDDEGRRKALLRRAVFASERKEPAAERAALATLRALVEPTGDKAWEGRLFGAEAIYFQESDDIETAQARAEASLEAFVESGLLAEEADARRRLAEIVTLRGDIDRAERLFNEARASADEAHEASVSVRALKGLYQVAFLRADSQRCFELAQAQLDIGYSSGDRRVEAEGHISMANALNMLRIRPHDAREHLEAATKAFSDIGSPVNVGMGLVMTGVHLCSVGDVVRARELCERALELYAAHPTPGRLKITALLTLAIATLIAGDGARATRFANEAVELARAMGFRFLEAAALGNLADAEAVAGDYRGAIEHTKQCIAMWADSGQRNEGTMFAHLALWFAALGRLDQARTYGLMAIETRDTFQKASFWPQECEWALAQALRACGETAQAASALERAHSWTLETLEHIEAEGREMFLDLPWHRQILAAVESDTWPDPPR